MPSVIKINISKEKVLYWQNPHDTITIGRMYSIGFGKTGKRDKKLTFKIRRNRPRIEAPVRFIANSFFQNGIFSTPVLSLQHLTEGTRIQSQLQSSLMLLSKTKEKYEKAFGASERALDAYRRADDDLNLSRAEVEKQRMNSTIKSQQYDDCKNEYANQLQKSNELQNKYYNQSLPNVFHGLQDLDERRIKCIKNFVLKAVQVEKEVLPIVSQCLDGMAHCAESIDEKEVNVLNIPRLCNVKLQISVSLIRNI